MTRRKDFNDLDLDYGNEVEKIAGTIKDKRQCEHYGIMPKMGCLECWISGWLFEDRRNPAHPFYRESDNITIRIT